MRPQPVAQSLHRRRALEQGVGHLDAGALRAQALGPGRQLAGALVDALDRALRLLSRFRRLVGERHDGAEPGTRLEVLGPPFYMNVYESDGRKLRYTPDDVAAMIEVCLQRAGS